MCDGNVVKKNYYNKIVCKTQQVVIVDHEVTDFTPSVNCDRTMFRCLVANFELVAFSLPIIANCFLGNSDGRIDQ